MKVLKYVKTKGGIRINLILITIIQILFQIISPHYQNSSTIKVYLQIETSQEQIKIIENEIRKINHVDSVLYVSKEEALDLMREKLGDERESVLEGYNYENNPLPDSFTVVIKSSKYKNQVIADIKAINDLYSLNPILRIRS